MQRIFTILKYLTCSDVLVVARRREVQRHGDQLRVERGHEVLDAVGRERVGHVNGGAGGGRGARQVLVVDR